MESFIFSRQITDVKSSDVVEQIIGLLCRCRDLKVLAPDFKLESFHIYTLSSALFKDFSHDMGLFSNLLTVWGRGTGKTPDAFLECVGIGNKNNQMSHKVLLFDPSSKVRVKFEAYRQNIDCYYPDSLEFTIDLTACNPTDVNRDALLASLSEEWEKIF